MPTMFENETFKNGAISLTYFAFNTYLTEAGFLYLESPNSFTRWFKRDSNQFCVDYALKRNKEPVLKFWASVEDFQEPDELSSMYAQWIICICLLMVLIVFPSVPANRNFNGIMLLHVIFSLFIVFVLFKIMNLMTMYENSCLRFTFCMYFFYIASFCWINVMAYNTWRTFGDYVEMQSARHTNGIRKMVVYSAYAWGLPLVLTICIAVVNSLDLRDTMPWFIQPNVPKHGCFIEGGEKLLYLLVPAFILLLVSLIFYLLTTRCISGIKQWTVQKPQPEDITYQFQNDYNWFKVQVAMFVAMVIHCLFEMAGSLTTNIYITYFSDIYGILWGPLLFSILIIYYRMLRKRSPNMSYPSQKKSQYEQRTFVNGAAT